MRTARPDLPALAGVALLGLLLLPTPASTGPQEGSEVRDVVSSEIAVSGRDATLRIEAAPGERLEIALRGGEVVVDGETVGSYTRGEMLDSAWRALLAGAVELDGAALARTLVAWSPPDDLAGEARESAERIDRELNELLTAPADEQQPEPAAEAPPERRGALEELLRRADRLAALAAALDELPLDGVVVEVDRDVEVSADEEIGGTLVVVDGDLDVRGRVRGDVVVVGGALRVLDGGRIDGEVRLADARLSRSDGEIAGAVRHVPAAAIPVLSDLDDLDELRDRIRREVRTELRDELRSQLRGRGDGPGLLAPLRHVGRGLVGLLRNVIGFAVLAALGLAVVHFFPQHLERVADAARRSPGRAALVGGAGAFLLLPAYALGAVALAVSVVGIPLLLAWVPLFPVAAGLAAGLGYLAVARLLGEWVVGRGLPGATMLRPSNTAHAVFGGLALLLLPYAAANLVQMAGPWLGFLRGLLLATGWLAAVLAVAAGLGAVLLTRGGRQSFYAPAREPYGGGTFDDETFGEEPFAGDEAPEEPGAGEGPSGGHEEPGGSGEGEPDADDHPPDGAESR